MARSTRIRGCAHEQRIQDLQRNRLEKFWPTGFHVVERDCLTMVLGVTRIHHILTTAGFRYWDAWNDSHPVLKPIAEILRMPLRRKVTVREGARSILTDSVLTQAKVEKATYAAIDLHFQLLRLGKTKQIMGCPNMRHKFLQGLLDRYKNRADLQFPPFRVEKDSRGVLRLAGSADDPVQIKAGSRENPIYVTEEARFMLREEFLTMSEFSAEEPTNGDVADSDVADSDGTDSDGTDSDVADSDFADDNYTDAGFVDHDLTDADPLGLDQDCNLPDPGAPADSISSHSNSSSRNSPQSSSRSSVNSSPTPVPALQRTTTRVPAASKIRGADVIAAATTPRKLRSQVGALSPPTNSQQSSRINKAGKKTPAARSRRTPRQMSSRPQQQPASQASIPRRANRLSGVPSCALLSPEASSSPSLEKSVPRPKKSATQTNRPLKSTQRPDSAPLRRSSRHIAPSNIQSDIALISPPASSTTVRVHKTPGKQHRQASKQPHCLAATTLHRSQTMSQGQETPADVQPSSLMVAPRNPGALSSPAYQREQRLNGSAADGTPPIPFVYQKDIDEVLPFWGLHREIAALRYLVRQGEAESPRPM